MSNIFRQKATDDFNKARFKAIITHIFNIVRPQNEQLLSLEEVKNLLQPKKANYKGMKAIEIEKIIGSEGRYNDFNKNFLPQHSHLRSRWESVDKAHLQDVILPPIKLYEIGGVYFVRDGNHRVSVAKAQGVIAIDAEVISLDSEFELHPNITPLELRQKVIEYEKKYFETKTNFFEIFPDAEIDFTATGRFDEIIQHIMTHKYFINQEQKEEIPLKKAIRSWYMNVYLPVINIIHAEDLASRFPGRTESDLYVWMIHHWHSLKYKYGEHISLEDAVKDYSEKKGRGAFRRFWDNLKSIIKWLLKK